MENDVKMGFDIGRQRIYSAGPAFAQTSVASYIFIVKHPRMGEITPSEIATIQKCKDDFEDNLEQKKNDAQLAGMFAGTNAVQTIQNDPIAAAPVYAAALTSCAFGAKLRGYIFEVSQRPVSNFLH